MPKNCKCGAVFTVAEEDRRFYETISPVIDGQKFLIPAPVSCPACRMQQRMAFRNERHLYKRKCDFSGKDIVSIYPPTSPHKVYDQKVWWSDQWDPMSYGRDFDFDRPFFEQMRELMLAVPQINLQNRTNENSDYCNDTNDMKNCYLCFNAQECADSFYVHTGGISMKNCVDLFWCTHTELCYECIKVHGAYHCFWCFNSQELSECFFCRDCRSCKNCFGCVGLRQKEYCVYNQQLSKEEYLKFIQSFRFTRTAIQEVQQKVAQLSLQVPHKDLEIHQSESCTGDYIQNSKNCTDCFDVIGSENCKYIWDGVVSNSYDCFNTGIDTNFAYECVGVYMGTNIISSFKCSLGCSNLMYCDFCFQSEYLLGCSGLRHKKYCILNKQYSKEEYEILAAKIIKHMRATASADGGQTTGEWGRFFPPSYSFYGYNDSLAQEYFPLSRDKALEQGFTWNDYVSPPPTGTNVIPGERLPDTVDGIPDDILNWVIQCENDGKQFKVIPQELAFYRTHGLPIPRQCPDCRHYARKAQINPRKLRSRTCDKCQKPIQTTYAPNRPEVVYCEECYLREVY